MKFRSISIELGRLVVALTFIISGILKGVDPVGLEIKIHDVITTVFGIANTSIIDLSWVVAYALIVLEFCIGAFLLMGIYRRLASRLAFLSLLFFTLFTGYTFFTGSVPDCGCFGDAFKLSPFESFIKNLVLLPISAWLVFCALEIKHLYSKREQWLPAFFAFAGISYFVYVNAVDLPIIDFRPYKVGHNIRERIQKADSIYQAELNANTKYIYERDGQQRAFVVDSLPDDTWHFVKVQQAEHLATLRPMDYNLLILTPEGEDVTQEILTDSVGVFLFVSPDWSKAKQSNYEGINALYEYLKRQGIKFYSLSPTKADSEAEWRYQTGAKYPNLFVDASTLKTMIRSNPGLIVLKKGRIMSKLSPLHFPKTEDVASFAYMQLEYLQTRFPYGRIIPLMVWSFLLLAGLIRRALRWLRVAVYLNNKPQK